MIYAIESIQATVDYKGIEEWQTKAELHGSKYQSGSLNHWQLHAMVSSWRWVA
jgi:hypothetical protein